MRQHLVIDLDERHRVAREAGAVRGDGGDLVADEAHFLAEDRLLAAEFDLVGVEAMDDRADPRQRFGLLRVDGSHARPRHRTAQDRRVEHARQLHVLRVRRATGDALPPVDARARLPDLRAFLARGRKIVAFDDDRRRVDLALEFVLALQDAQPGHQRFFRDAATSAATMFVYAPQRQRLPETARLTSSARASGSARSSATTDMTWPGVQNPHWNASWSTNACCRGWSSPCVARPSIVSIERTSHEMARVRQL